MSHQPIAYTYEADHHCPECAEERFGRCKEHGQIACCVTDSEGNEPGAEFSWDEHTCGVTCGTCGETILDHPDVEMGESCTECGYNEGDE